MDKNEEHAHAFKPNDDKVSLKIKSKSTSNKVKEALVLPTCINLNPRSIYNKAKDFKNFIQEQQVHCVFLRESWERPEFTLSQLLDI